MLNYIYLVIGITISLAALEYFLGIPYLTSIGFLILVCYVITFFTKEFFTPKPVKGIEDVLDKLLSFIIASGLTACLIQNAFYIISNN